MVTIRVFEGRVIKTKEGKKTSFYIDTRGVIYDKTPQGVRKVGNFVNKSEMDIYDKYKTKYPTRLEILMKLINDK